MNYYPFHVGDYAAHTAHLEPMEDLAYRRLLDVYYLREAALPADIQVTAKLVRMRSMASDVESVLNEFFELTDAGWTHARCDEEIAHMQDKQAKARASAAASVKARQAFADSKRETRLANVERSIDQMQADVNKNSTDVQLPTPTPTPTPTPVFIKDKDKAQAPAAYGDLLSGVDKQVLSDWVALRKSKKAPITRTAVEGLIAEAQLAGMTTEDAMRTSCANGWQGFKADWVAKSAPTKTTSPSRHAGFKTMNYSEGVNADGTLA